MRWCRWEHSSWVGWMTPVTWVQYPSLGALEQLGKASFGKTAVETLSSSLETKRSSILCSHDDRHLIRCHHLGMLLWLINPPQAALPGSHVAHTRTRAGPRCPCPVSPMASPRRNPSAPRTVGSGTRLGITFGQTNSWTSCSAGLQLLAAATNIPQPPTSLSHPSHHSPLTAIAPHHRCREALICSR